MSNEISNQNIAGLQDEMLRNISSIKQKVSEWLERPQVGGIESLCEAMSEIRNILSLLNKTEAAELCDTIIAVVLRLQDTVEKSGDDKPENFDNIGAEIASAILILDDYIEHLTDKRDARENILAMLNVMRSLKEDATSAASYTAQPRISKDTYQALASKVSEIIESSRNQIEQHRRDNSTPLNADTIIGHNKELISLFAALNLLEPQFLLQKVNQILSSTPTEAQWIDVAEAMILVDETLRQGSSKHAATAVSDYTGARLQQTRHSRQLEVEHLLKDTGETAAQFFDTLSKKVAHDETIEKTQGWRAAAIRLAHYSAISDLVGFSSLSSALRGMGKVYTAMSLQDSFPDTVYKPVIESLVGAEYIFSDLSQNSRPSEQDIAFLKDAVVQIAEHISVSAEAERQFTGFIDASETEIAEEREDLSGTFGEILSGDLDTLDRFGAPIALENIDTHDTEEDVSTLSPTMVHVASIKDIQTGATPAQLENVSIHSNVRSASDSEAAIPVAPSTSSHASHSEISSSESITTPAVDALPPSSESSSSFSDNLSSLISSDDSIPSSHTNANVQFIPFFRDKTFADLNQLQVPVNKKEFVDAHTDAVMDDEIREFFGEEFAEILERLNEAFPKWNLEPDSTTLTTDIRRAFHTLKGSGRTVGYESLGEFAWQHEQLLNRILDNHYRANPLVQSTVGDAIDLLNILNQQQEFSEHQGALLQQAAAAESVREALLQDGELGENAQTFAQASLQWRLHDGNVSETASFSIEEAAPVLDAQVRNEPPSSIDFAPTSVVSSEQHEESNADYSADDTHLLKVQDDDNSAEKVSHEEVAESWTSSFELLPQEEQTQVSPALDKENTAANISSDIESLEQETDQWISPFDLLPQDQVGVTAADNATQSSPASEENDSLAIALDLDWDTPSDSNAMDDNLVQEKEEESDFALMSDEEWQQLSQSPQTTSETHEEATSDSYAHLSTDENAIALDADVHLPPASQIPDEMAKSDVFESDTQQPLESITIDDLPHSDAHIVSKVVRTLEKGLAHDEIDETVNQALQATLERQLQGDLLDDPERLAALAQAVQQQMANNDAAMLGQVQSIFSHMQAQASWQNHQQEKEITPIDPRAEQIVRMLEKGLANSTDNPALTQALEATLQRRLSDDVLGDSTKLDALLEEISATLAAFPTITPDTAQSDDFLASVEQISQSIELGLSLGELSPDDKDALAAAIKQELLFPPACDQDSEQLKEAVEIRLQEKQLLPAGDIRDVVQKAFSTTQIFASQSPTTPEIKDTHSPDVPPASQDEALLADFSWSDMQDHADTAVSSSTASHSEDTGFVLNPPASLPAANTANNTASATADKQASGTQPTPSHEPVYDVSAPLSTMQKTLDKALSGDFLDDSAVAAIGMTLARQWQQNHLPANEAAFSQIAEKLRDNNPHHDRQNVDNVLRALADRLGVSPLPEEHANLQPTQPNGQGDDFGFADNADSTSIATLQKTLDKALRAGDVDESVANAIGMALAHQWQHYSLPRDETGFANIAAQLRHSSQAYNTQDIENILGSLAQRLGVEHPIESGSNSAEFNQWFDFDENTDIKPASPNIEHTSLATLQKTLDKALQSGTVDDSIATSIGMALARQWQQANIPADDTVFAQIAHQLRAHGSQHRQQDIDQILNALADRLGVTTENHAPLSHQEDTAIFGDNTVQVNAADENNLGTEKSAFTSAVDDTWDADTFLSAQHHDESFQSSFASESSLSDDEPADTDVTDIPGETIEIETETESAWDIEDHTPQSVSDVSSSQPSTAKEAALLSFDFSDNTGKAPASTVSAGEDWNNTVEYVRPSISMKSSAASQRLSQELEQLAQHPMLDDALVRYNPISAEDSGADTAVFLHAVDRFENLSQRIEDKNDPDTINELIESVYDIEDSIESDSAPDWIWQMLDAVEQLLLMYKYQGAHVSSSAASILRQSAHLIEHHRDQDSEEEALETINSLIAARQERSKMSAAPQDQAISSAYAAASDTYSDELLQDPNANSMLSETFLDEAMTLFGRSQLDAERWDEDLSRLGILDRIRRDMHTLKGSARMAGYMAIGDLTHSVENLIDSILDGYSEASSRAAAILSGAMWQGMLMLDNIRDGYLPQTDPYILNNISEYLNQPLPYPEVAEQEKLAKEQQRQEAEEAQFRPINAPVSAPAAPEVADTALAEEAVFGEGFDSDIDPILVDVFTDEAEELLANTEHYLEEDITGTAIAEEFKRTMHTLKGSARLVGLSTMGDTAHLMESVMEKMPELSDEQVEQARTLLQGGYESLRNMLDAVLRQEMPKAAVAVNRSLELFVREGQFVWPPVQEEAAAPDQSADAPQTPDFADASRHEPAAAETVLQDTSVAPHQELSDTPAPMAHTAPEVFADHVAEEKSAAADTTSSAPPMTEEAPAAEKPDAKKEEDLDRSADKAPDVSRFVRVDAQLLDEIIAMVGEASIMRSRMENISGGVEFSLGELTRISTRIAEQMRRLDNETEAQMLFRREQRSNDDEHFDPLEMDRFTEIQQLSRQLSEAIDDLKNVQDTLANDNTLLRNLASQQGIIQRSLQDRLLTTQLMRFDVNEPRLKRLVRQTARAVGKDVQFVLEGGQVELERRLLEDVLPALEHMIRNSIAHGIELPAQRRAAGKPEIGTIKLVVAVQASEVVMRLIDDGQGFDYDRIRSKAREKGFLDEALANDKQYLNSLILRSGFSTAQSLTQISGRGVGMDVVNEMVKQRRGRLGADSLPGKGTEFTIVMPFSMSISEVLLVDIGGRTYAAPMSSITAVSQVSREDLQSSVEGHAVYHHYDEHDYRLYVLGQYFEPRSYEFTAESPQLPALFVDSGDEAAAFHVDRILNRLEIIVKNVNRQVLNIPGISGATILGDASVVPVLELMDLARRIGGIVPNQEVEALPESTEKRILVVDDSVTMRKVSTRLLERNHFIVETAKDGLDAIQVLQQFKPDLIMLDIEMPRMDGFEFATHVRQNSDIPDVPIVMVTSRTGDKHRERAGQIGVQGYLGKPYREDILMETLNSLLGSGDYHE